MRGEPTPPQAAGPLLCSFCAAFSPQTFQRFLVPVIGATLSPGRRTVCACLRAARSTAPGHPGSYHGVSSHAVWSPWPLGEAPAAAVLGRVPAGPVVVTVDDTAAMHKGRRVYGKEKHHDACRSTHSHRVWKWGHKWAVLAVHANFPLGSRARALPVLAALYRPAELNRREHRRHKTAPLLARQPAAVLIRWLPQRKFVSPGDGGYASHELAAFCRRRRHPTLVSRLHPRANLYDLPPRRIEGAKGRPRAKGRKRSCPADVVARTPRSRRSGATASWYGGAERRIEFVSGSGHGYKAGRGPAAVRWVLVHDLGGTDRRGGEACPTNTSIRPTRP